MGDHNILWTAHSFIMDAGVSNTAINVDFWKAKKLMITITILKRMLV